MSLQFSNSEPNQSPTAEQTRWFDKDVLVHEPSLKAYLRASFPAIRDVDDVVQESYLRIWKARLTHPISATKSFLFQVARHLAIDLLRRDRISPIQVVSDLADLHVSEDRASVVDAACTSDELELLAVAIHSLPVRCRRVVVLRQVEGMSQKEIAAQLGLSELTVQTHVVNGLRRLEKYLCRRGLVRSTN